MSKSKINYKIGVIGLGYIGIHVAVAFGYHFSTIGYDINKKRIKQLRSFIDSNNELNKKEIKLSKKLNFSYDKSSLLDCNIYIVTVPTPITSLNKPDLKYIKSACKILGYYLKKGDIVVFESTLYPGCTENYCVPLLEKASNLKYGNEFFCAYSPERINPGDTKKKFKNINKIVGATNSKTTNLVSSLYQKIIIPKIYKTSSIIVAESSKIIENTQRDLNIALMNELAIIFSRLNVDTKEVIDAASTKWNFNTYYPGMVGGHCIGVDPYYLSHISEKLGYQPKLILRGRKINENVSIFVYNKILKLISKKNTNIKKLKILILGATFKKNCPDIRNSKVFDLIDIFKTKALKVNFFDPYITNKIQKYKNDQLTSLASTHKYDIVMLAVDHYYFTKMGLNKLKKFGKKSSIFFDINGFFSSVPAENKL